VLLWYCFGIYIVFINNKLSSSSNIELSISNNSLASIKFAPLISLFFARPSAILSGETICIPNSAESTAATKLGLLNLFSSLGILGSFSTRGKPRIFLL